MSIEYIDSGVTNTIGTKLPDGVSPGDDHYVFITVASGNKVTGPEGWEEIRAVWWRRLVRWALRRPQHLTFRRRATAGDADG